MADRLEALKELREALKPFVAARKAIPDHFEGRHPLKAQVVKGLRLPTVDEYRRMYSAACVVFGDLL